MALSLIRKLKLVRSGLVVGALVLPAAGAAHAQSATVKIVGLGATRCAQFLSEVGKNAAVQREYLAWAQGYMSGILVTRPPGVDEKLDLTPQEFPLIKQLKFLRDQCVAHPAETFADAVERLYRQLRREGMT